MITINLDKHFVDLESMQESKDEPKMSVTLARILANSQDDDYLKYYDWAMSLYKNGSLQCDESDSKKLVDFIKESKVLNNSGKAQLQRQVDAELQAANKD